MGLAQAAAVLDSRLEAAAQREAPYAELLADLLGAEAAARRARYLTTRTRLAHLPFQRTLAQFDFAFQPSVDERQVRELATMAFVADAANVLLLGHPVVATAVLDCLLHHSHVLNIRGESYRLREKKRAGLFGTPPTPPTRPAGGPDSTSLTSRKTLGGSIPTSAMVGQSYVGVDTWKTSGVHRSGHLVGCWRYLLPGHGVAGGDRIIGVDFRVSASPS